MKDVLFSPVGCAALTFVLYAAAQAVYARNKFFLLHPVLTAAAALIALLKIAGIPYDVYREGGDFIGILLGPSVVALGVPLYREFGKVRRQAGAVLATTLFGSLVGLLSAAVPLLVWEAPRDVAVSVLPKSATTPIAMAVVEGLGGIPSLSAAVVVATGILGAALGPIVLKLLRLTDPAAFGLALGVASHGIGTARALETGEEEGAFSSLGLCLNGVMTALLTPLAVRLLFSI